MDLLKNKNKPSWWSGFLWGFISINYVYIGFILIYLHWGS